MDDGIKTETRLRALLQKHCLVVALVITLMVATGCQPPSRTGSGLFGSGQRLPFGAAGNSSLPGSSFNSPFDPNQGSTTRNGTNQFLQPGAAQEFDRINRQLGAFDADNQMLNTEVAELTAKLELANQYNQALKQQLSDTSDRISQNGNQSRATQQQLASYQQEIQQLRRQLEDQNRQLSQRGFQPNWPGQSGPAGSSSPFRTTGFSGNQPGSATIRANNGLMQRFNSINIPGGNARMDGDTIRIEFPTDRLFASGTYNVQRSQLPMLQNIASTIRQSFPRQIVGIEAHWDGTPLNPPGTSDHQLTATQSLSVLEELVRLGLPPNQMFNMAMASNRPRHRQQIVAGVSPNRRIEIVIYPETFDAS